MSKVGKLLETVEFFNFTLTQGQLVTIIGNRCSEGINYYQIDVGAGEYFIRTDAVWVLDGTEGETAESITYDMIERAYEGDTTLVKKLDKAFVGILVKPAYVRGYQFEKGDEVRVTGEVVADRRYYEVVSKRGEVFYLPPDYIKSEAKPEELKKCADAIINNEISHDAIKKVFSIDKATPYEMVNHPSHYNNYSVEVIDMMERIYGTKDTIAFCEMNAFKYRMRLGTKPDNSIEQDLAKEKWYIDKAKELRAKLQNYESAL